MQRPPTVVVLKEGVEATQGKGMMISNINAVLVISQALKTTLGPRGMDKLIVDINGNTTVSNDGATIIKLMDIVHPAARTLVDIARAQDQEIGDGTTSVVVLAGELLAAAKPFVEEGIHSRVLLRAYRRAAKFCDEQIAELRVKLADEATPAERRDRLIKLAKTAMNSKLVATCKDHMAEICVSAIECVGDDIDLSAIGIKQVLGGELSQSMLVDGVAFEKTHSFVGYGQLPKSIRNPKICILTAPLEWEKERENAEVRLTDPSKLREIVDAEYRILYSKLERIVAAGANVVLSTGSIGDLATQFFCQKGVFCAGRVPKNDIVRLHRTSGAMILASANDVVPSALGTVDAFETKFIGSTEFNIFHSDAKRVATIVLRGGARQFIAESERSINDAIQVVRRAAHAPEVVGGGGAIEVELRRRLLELSRTLPGKEQFVVEAYADALLVIPRQLSLNAGFDGTKITEALIHAHANGKVWEGVDIERGATWDSLDHCVWEPALIKINALRAATEAACTILSIDDTVVAPPDAADAVREGQQQTADMQQRLAAAGINPSVQGMSAMQGRNGR